MLLLLLLLRKEVLSLLVLLLVELMGLKSPWVELVVELQVELAVGRLWETIKDQELACRLSPFCVFAVPSWV